MPASASERGDFTVLFITSHARAWRISWSPANRAIVTQIDNDDFGRAAALGGRVRVARGIAVATK